MKKNIASMANETMNATMFAPRNERERKNWNWTIGALPCVSTSANAGRPTTAVISSATLSGEPQPQPLPSTSASTSADRPMLNVPMPAKSTRRSTVLSNDSRTANSVTITAPIATGRFRKKIARQETYSVSAPPTAGPSASASADTPAQVPIARPRAAGRGGREGVGDDREGAGHHDRGAHALHGPAGNEPRLVRREADQGARRG